MRLLVLAAVLLLLALLLPSASAAAGGAGRVTQTKTKPGGRTPFLSTVVNGVRQSAKLEPASLQLTSTSLMLVGFVSAAVSLFTFNLLTERINSGAVSKGFKGDVQQLLIFDLRNGYSASEVEKTLTAWGRGGRWAYLLIELIDVTFYHSGYRLAFLVLYNKITQTLGKLVGENIGSAIVKLGYFPILLAILDMTEDAFQVAMTLLFDFSSAAGAKGGLFNALAFCASTMNQIKWKAVSVGAPLFALTAATLGALTAFKAVKPLFVGGPKTK